MAKWNHSGAQVFGANSPTSWTSLDLSTDITPSPTGFTGRGLALLKVQVTAGNPYVGFRPFDESGDWYHSTTEGHGVCSAKPNSASGDSALLLVPTSENAKVAWMASAAVNAKVYLLGWIEAEYDFTEVFPENNLPSSWTDLDISEITGDNESFSFFSFRQTGGTSNDIGTRPDGDTDDWLDTKAGAVGGASQGNSGATGKTTAIVQIPDSSKGTIEIIANTAVPNGSIDLIMHEVDGWYSVGTTAFSMNNPPGTWTDLNLGNPMYTRRGLAVLKIERDSSVSGSLVGFGLRPKGDAGNYLDAAMGEPAGAGTCSIEASESTLLLCETDATGYIQWISSNVACQCELTLIGFLSVNEPPTFSGQSPTGSSIDPDEEIDISISDDDSTTQSSIQMTWIDPNGSSHNVIVNGVFQGSYSGNIAANGSNGYNIKVNSHPDMNVGQWTVTVTASDNMGKSSTTSWDFTVDTATPVVSNKSPSGIVTEQFDRIYCKISDPWGIDTSTIGFVARSTSREELTGIVGGVFQTGWDGWIVTEASGTVAHVNITEWPELEDIRTWTFEVTGQSDVGKEF